MYFAGFLIGLYCCDTSKEICHAGVEAFHSFLAILVESFECREAFTIATAKEEFLVSLHNSSRIVFAVVIIHGGQIRLRTAVSTPNIKLTFLWSRNRNSFNLKSIWFLLPFSVLSSSPVSTLIPRLPSLSFSVADTNNRNELIRSTKSNKIQDVITLESFSVRFLVMFNRKLLIFCRWVDLKLSWKFRLHSRK